MSVIIVDEGFTDKSEHSIDIKIFINDDNITIRLRDDCTGFDTKKRTAMMNPEDPISSLGIRLIKHYSKNTEFYSTLNVNYLVLHIDDVAAG